MFRVLLAVALSTALAGSAWGDDDDVKRSIKGIERQIEGLRKEQQEFRIDQLKDTIHELRRERTDEKLEELRRSIGGFHGHPGGPLPVLVAPAHEPLAARLAPVTGGPLPVLVAPAAGGVRSIAASPSRAVVQVSVPDGATLFVNDEEVPVAAPRSSYLTPELEPGKQYHYDFRVRVEQGGRIVTRTKRMGVSPGAVVRLNYDDMTAAGQEPERNRVPGPDRNPPGVAPEDRRIEKDRDQ